MRQHQATTLKEELYYYIIITLIYNNLIRALAGSYIEMEIFPSLISGEELYY